MKNIIRYKMHFLQMAVILILASLQNISCQNAKEQPSQIPENINKIFQASCLNCHGSNGRLLALAKLNLSKWAEYTAVEKAKKASGICSELTEGKMPPKSVRKSNPELIPSKQQIELICKWAESLKPEAEGK
jgi:mono/diheme cytochrome c family protein